VRGDNRPVQILIVKSSPLILLDAAAQTALCVLADPLVGVSLFGGIHLRALYFVVCSLPLHTGPFP
jgi:hypothetical protein